MQPWLFLIVILKFFTRGIEISANHIKSVSNGYVTGIAKPLHLGRTTQLWQINVFDDNQNLISICKLTTLTLQKKIKIFKMKSVIICDMEGVIQKMNKGAAEMFGYDPKELIGIKRVSLFHQEK